MSKQKSMKFADSIVIINDNKTLNLNSVFKRLDNGVRTGDDYVLYDEDNKSFSIRYNGEDYDNVIISSTADLETYHHLLNLATIKRMLDEDRDLGKVEEDQTINDAKRLYLNILKSNDGSNSIGERLRGLLADIRDARSRVKELFDPIKHTSDAYFKSCACSALILAPAVIALCIYNPYWLELWIMLYMTMVMSVYPVTNFLKFFTSNHARRKENKRTMLRIKNSKIKELELSLANINTTAKEDEKDTDVEIKDSVLKALTELTDLIKTFEPRTKNECGERINAILEEYMELVKTGDAEMQLKTSSILTKIGNLKGDILILRPSSISKDNRQIEEEAKFVRNRLTEISGEDFEQVQRSSGGKRNGN